MYIIEFFFSQSKTRRMYPIMFVFSKICRKIVAK